MPEPKSRALSRTQWLLLAVLFVTALFLRVQQVRHTDVVSPLRQDSLSYASYAYNLAHHGVYSQDMVRQTPDSLRPPGYPLFMALGFVLAGERGYYDLTLYFQAALGALTVLLAFALGLRFLPPWAAFFAAALVAFSPHLVSLSGYLLKETLFAFLLLAALAMFFRALERGRRGLFAFAGALAGLAYLVNPPVFFLPFFWALAAWLAGKKARRPQLFCLVLFLAAFCLFPAGWKARDAWVVPEDAPREGDLALQTMIHGIYVDFVHENPKYFGYGYREDPQYEKMSSSWKDFQEVFFERVSERPARYLAWYLAKKPYWLWYWDNIQGVEDIYIYPVTRSLYKISRAADMTRVAMRSLHPLLLVLALAGATALFFQKRWRPDRALPGEAMVVYVVLVPLYFTALYTLFNAMPRYSIPLRPEMYLVAAYGVYRLTGRFGLSGPTGKRFSGWVSALAVAALAAFCALGFMGADLGTHPPRKTILEKDVPTAHYNKAHYGGIQALSEKDMDRALARFESAVALRPQSPLDRVYLANVLATQNQPLQAVRHLSAALAFAPQNAVANNTMGLILARKGRAMWAGHYLLEAKKAAPQMEAARKNLRQLMAQVNAALKKALDAQTHGPVEPGAALDLAELWLMSGGPEKALEVLAKLEELCAGRGDSPVCGSPRLAGVWMDAGDRQKARAVLEEALADNPANAPALYQMARLHDLEGRDPEAVQALELAVKAGFRDSLAIWADPALTGVRKIKHFEDIAGQMKHSP